MHHCPAATSATLLAVLAASPQGGAFLSATADPAAQTLNGFLAEVERKAFRMAQMALRWVQMKWGITFLQEAKGMTLIRSSWLAMASLRRNVSMSTRPRSPPASNSTSLVAAAPDRAAPKETRIPWRSESCCAAAESRTITCR